MTRPHKIDPVFPMLSLALLVGATSVASAQQYQYPSTGGYAPISQDEAAQGSRSAAPQYPATSAPAPSQPRYQPSAPTSRYDTRQDSNQYDRGASYQAPAPVVRGEKQQRQPINQPYTRVHDGDAQRRDYAPQEARGFGTTQALGPYDDYRQRDEYRPNFNERPAPTAQPELFEPAKLIAIVREKPILAGDLYGDIEQMLAPYKDQATEEQLDEQRQLLLQRLLPQMIQTKMLYQEMLANVPEEALPQIEAKLANEFDEKQLPVLMERAKVESPAQLDAKLREFGSSIEKQRRQFAEQILAREVVRQNVQSEPDVSHQEMLRYYQEHAEEYDRPARVRWEELAVRFDEFQSKSEAYRAIANMGNRVLRGAAFSRVAREQSQGFTAEDGGWYDWTQRGTLKFPEIEEAIFTLPPNQLSRVIETDLGFHVIRILDREEAGRKPFFQEQSRIKLKIQKEKRDAQVEEYLAKVQERTRVWTIFDDGEQATP